MDFHRFWRVLLIKGLFCLPFMALAEDQTINVAITQIVEHPSLNAVRKGFIEFLNKSKFKGKIKFDYSNAQGNMITNSHIARKILGSKPHAILALGTPAAQAVINKNHTIPVLFSPITDPVEAKLVKNLLKPGGIATGTSDRSPVKKQLELILQIQSKVKKIAMIYNPSEANSTSILKQFQEACSLLKTKCVEAVVPNTASVYSTAASLKGRGVDAIYVPTDNTVVSAIEAVIKAGNAAGIPVFSAESESVKKGTIAALAVNYFKLGQLTAAMLAEILDQKTSPAQMPVRFQKEFELHINQSNAKKMGVIFPGDLLKKATVHPSF